MRWSPDEPDLHHGHLDAEGRQEEAFVAAWQEVARWASQMPGAGTLRLARDTNGPGQYVSFGRWDSIDEVHAWKASPEFRQRMVVVQEHVDRFSPAELALVATIDAGAVVP